jgi:polysaccharide export outer membrane protein
VRTVALAGLAALPAAAQVADVPEGSARSVGSDYTVGIEDQLMVFVWGEPDLTVHVRVRPDGKITVPLVNDVAVVGLSTDQIRQRIRDGLATFIRDPNVTVMVEEINSFRVYFVGEVERQGALQFYRPTRLLQGIASAGGLTEYAKKEIILLREDQGIEKKIRIDYKRLISSENAEDNLYLKPGDTLLFL